MILKELKNNYKTLIIWFLITAIVLVGVLSLYPSIVDSMNLDQINEMMASMPDSFLKTVNMDIASITSAFGWYQSEGMVYFNLIVNSYAAILGANILLKEESDKTIEFLLSKPVTRNNVLTSKIVIGIINILILTILSAVIIAIPLIVNDDIVTKKYILLSISPLLSAIPLYLFMIDLSMFFKKSKKIFGVSIGLVFISYLFSLISTISDKTEFFKYASFFTLADQRNIITNTALDSKLIIISMIMTVILGVLAYIIYNRKEFD